jgi:competence transcription factor ComK
MLMLLSPSERANLNHCNSETSVDFRWITHHYITEDRTLYNRSFDILKFCNTNEILQPVTS